MKRRGFLKAGVTASLGAFIPHSDSLANKIFDREETNIPVIDTHVHLWDLQNLDYPWLENNNSILSKNFLVADFQKATKDCPIEKMIFVECGRLEEQYLKEVDWVVNIAKEEPRIKGMVAYFPLEKERELIPGIEELTSRKIVKGIRRGVGKELINNAQFIKGLRLLPKYDLSFDLNLSPSLMSEAIPLIKKCPNTRFILDHLGNPDIKSNEMDGWQTNLSKLAEMDNVYCKISGIITKADPAAWKVDDLVPYVDHALEAFGTDRVVFGGDWPVVLLAGTYKDWFSSFKSLVQGLGYKEKERLFYQNAAAFYRV